MATGCFNVIVVGHNVAAKCDVANALMKQNSFKQFTSCKKLSVKVLRDKTLEGDALRLVMTPNLNTPSWASGKLSIQSNKVYLKRMFIYVKDISSFEIDDEQSITNLYDNFGEVKVILVLHHDESDDSAAAELCQNLVKSFKKRFVCFKSSSKSLWGNATQTLLTMLSEIASSNVKIPPKTYVGKQYVDNRPAKPADRQKSKVDDVGATEDTELLESVAVESRDERARTPENVIVNLEKVHFDLYHKALEWGMVQSYHTRVNVVGHQSAGKTTLVRRLQSVDSTATEPTEALHIDKTITRAIEIDGVRTWDTKKYGFDKDLNYQRMAQAMLKVKKKKRESDCHSSNPFSGHNMDMASDEIIDDKESINENVKGVEHFQKYINSESKKAYLHQVVRKMEHSPGQRMYLAYWDFAGQSTYYNTHQAFMSPSAVYLLVVDLSKSLDQKEKSTLNFRTHRIQEISVLESVRFWTGSIKAYTADENKAVAPVIVVGTHKDKVQPERIEHIFEEIREVMRIPEVPCIAINNTLPSVDDSALKELRDRIVDGGIGIIETEIPAKWIELEYSLIKLKNEGKVFLSFEELQSLDLKTDAPLSDQTLLNAFLEHEHCRGFLMYFPHGDLKDIIILDPLILVSFINQIMRKKPKLSDSLRERASQSGWCSDGVFDQTFLNEAINNLDATCTKKTDLPLLVKVCIHLKLIYPKTKASLERNTDAFNLYFMPCLLEDKPDKVQDYSNVDAEKTPMIKISFEKKPIPPAFFHSLLASLLSEWPPQKIDNNGKIYNEYVCFCLEGETCILEMYWSESNIYLRIINFSIRRKLKDINCYKYIVSVEQHIGAILQLYRHVNIDVFIGVRCPKHEHAYVSLKKLVYSSDREAMCHAGDSTHHHSVVAEDVLNTWFPDESIHYKPATTKEPSREQKELEKVPNDKCLGRLSRLINFEDAHSLATKLKMDDPSLAAKRATEESPHSKNLALFKIMKRWREMNDSPTTETLLDLLTKRQLHRRKDIVSALFKDVKQQRYDQQLQLDLDKPPTDRQCGIMGQYIDQYVFVFLELGHSYVSIERAREEVGHYQIATTITNLLIQWKNKFNENASIRNFLDVAKMFNLDVDKLLEDLVKNIR